MARPPTGQVLELRRDRGTVYALRFRAYGRRQYVTLDVSNLRDAELELQNVLADVRRGTWKPPAAEPTPAPVEEPTFHLLASEWVQRRRHEVDQRTVEHFEWALTCHLLPMFAGYDVSSVTVAAIEQFKTAKLTERARWEQLTPEMRRELGLGRPLSNGSINKTLKVLAQVLDYAIDLDYVAENAARGKNRRLKAAKPRRTWLELDEARAVIDAAGDNRTLLATMILAGLRVGELIALRWRDVDLARGTVKVRESKTDAGVRVVDLSPDLRELLTLHRAAASDVLPEALVFPTSRGTKRDRSNILRDVLRPAVAAANESLTKIDLPPIADAVTNHTLRRTFASLLYEAGASPAYVMAQMGHTSADLALEVYAKKMQRSRDTGARMDALIRGADWAPTGTSAPAASDALLVEQTKTPLERGFSRLRD